MRQSKNQEKEIRQDYENTESRNEQEADNNHSSEVENPNPSTATPTFPTELPSR
jgi:hypothetical protein